MNFTARPAFFTAPPPIFTGELHRIPARSRDRQQLALLCLLGLVLTTTPAAAASLPQGAKHAVFVSFLRGPSHGRPELREDGRKGGAGRAQAEGRARNRVGSTSGKTTRWIWDGNVPLHEWVERAPDAVDEDFTRPVRKEDSFAANERALKALLAGRPANGPPAGVDAYTLDAQKRACAEGTAEAPVTWVFEPESFAPLAKLVERETYAIVTDHLGTPRAMFDGRGREVWGADIDAYGDLRNVRGERQACPFRWPGQYEDGETGLYCNRWRYYDRPSGQYCSHDPVRVDGGLRVVGYAVDPLVWTDALGLSQTCMVSGKPRPARITPGSLPSEEENAVRDTLGHIDAGTVPTGKTKEEIGDPFSESRRRLARNSRSWWLQ